MRSVGIISGLASLLPVVLACGSDGGSCYGPTNTIEHVRQVKRMQPGAPGAAYGPKAPLEWGQINFLHTTDSHGWLEGHIKEKNYGADWGDFVSFSRRMKQAAHEMDVDLLLIDTGDLHQGTGLSDATTPDGDKSMPIFGQIDYDLMAMGNHELYETEVSYQIFMDYASKWGDRYVTSNVKILNQTSGQYEHVGVTHRYFTTEKGLRIMAYGLLFDFNQNSNVSQVIKAKDMVQEPWFIETIKSTEPVDLYILLGHNPVSLTDPVSTFKVVWDAIRKEHPQTPIQIFGGHTHIRDFSVYDDSSVAIEAGRYCETLGWVSMSGFDTSYSGFKGVQNPRGVPNPSRKAKPDSKSPFLYSRRYLDWNRKTFAYHTKKTEEAFDTAQGLNVTAGITKVREELKLGEVYGCAPETWCIDCVPFGKPGNIYSDVFIPAITELVVSKPRADKSRLYIGNTGVVRFDLYKGPFTYDDNFIVSPYKDVFMYIPNVPIEKAKTLLEKLNKPKPSKREELASMPLPRYECTDPTLGHLTRRQMREPRGIVRRQETVVLGHVTTDDWGNDGDDTVHSLIPSFKNPKHWEARINYPEKQDPETVDIIFFDFLEGRILTALGGYTKKDVSCYVDCDYSTRDVMLPYAKLKWQKNIENCPIE